MKELGIRSLLKIIIVLVLLLIGATFLPGCKESSTIPTTQADPTLTDYQGGVFKGPFLVGSTVTIYPLDSNLDQTGVSFSGDIISDDGTYDISGIEVSGSIELVASGYYFDEITGVVTDNQMTMRAITEDTGTVNINLFTALEYDRVKYLYSTGMSITESKSQAIGEIFTAFGLSSYQDDAGDINIQTANGAELLAVSSMFAYGRSPAEVQAAITELRVDFIDGVADVSTLTDNAKYIDASEVKANLDNYFDTKMIVATVPDFVNELYSLYGSDNVTGEDNNKILLTSTGSVIYCDTGLNLAAGFIVPSGVVLTIRVVESADWVRFYNGNGFTVSSDLNEAVAQGPGFIRLDNSVLYGPAGYQFDIVVLVDGVEVSRNTYELLQGQWN